MTREEPLFKKCCFCIPLKTILLIWAIIKLLALLLGVAYGIFVMILMTQYKDNSVYVQMVPTTLLLLIDVCAIIMFIIGACENNFKLIRIYFYYHICFIIAAIVMLSTTFAVFRFNQSYPYPEVEPYCFIPGCVIYIVLEIAVLFTVHSKMIKLRNIDQYSFAKINSNVYDLEEEMKY